MGLKHHTIILVPHSRAKFRKWTVSTRQLVAAGLTAVLLLLLTAVSTWSFFFSTIEKSQLAQLEQENLQLREINQDFETSVRELDRQLVDFEDRTRQLAIVAGLDGLGGEQDPGIGGEDLLLPDQGTLGHLHERAVFLDRGLDSVGAELAERLQLAASTPSISPVRGLLTSSYGYRNDPVTGQRALHRAIDISTAPGRPVKATADGFVLRAKRNGRLGNSIDISHGHGVITRYGHLASYNIEPGQRVRHGEVIGFVGNTGRTTGFHLHYEVRLDGQPVNPLAYVLDKRPSRS
ncbi:MAG: peptidoglycan DD-metalloendopeptidase family protein [Nitrospirae bacterium]|nr:peptidoglycan DD-metalloendopeptidase family protein [Nitrospirota bacterium]